MYGLEDLLKSGVISKGRVLQAPDRYVRMRGETVGKWIESCYGLLRFNVIWDLITELIHPYKHI